MRQLSWREYSQNFDSWAESTRENYVNRITDFAGANHQEVADTVAAIYNVSAASKLANMAMNAGIRFDSQDIYLIEESVDAETLERARNLQDIRGEIREQKKKNHKDFWTGVGSVMFVDDTIDAIFGKKTSRKDRD